LQLASSNAARLDLTPYPTSIVRAAESTPDGLDLAEPATLDLTQLALRNQDDGYDDEDEDDDEEYNDEDDEAY